MYRIGDFSKMTKTTIKTLRYYDEVNLLNPEYTDKFTGYRFYSTKQLFEFHQIQSYRQIGLTIEEIKLIQKGHDLETILNRRKIQLESELRMGQEQMSRIDFILLGKEEEAFMNYQAIIKKTPECIVYYTRQIVPNYDAYFDLMPKIGEEVASSNPGLKCTVPEYCFIRYLDGEYKEKDISIEFCEAVEAYGNETENIKFKNMDSLTVASVMHKGPYSDLGKAYAFIMKWIEENGYTISDIPRESYIDGIWNKENPEDWLTEIQVPVEKK